MRQVLAIPSPAVSVSSAFLFCASRTAGRSPSAFRHLPPALRYWPAFAVTADNPPCGLPRPSCAARSVFKPQQRFQRSRPAVAGGFVFYCHEAPRVCDTRIPGVRHLSALLPSAARSSRVTGILICSGSVYLAAIVATLFIGAAPHLPRSFGQKNRPDFSGRF